MSAEDYRQPDHCEHPETHTDATNPTPAPTPRKVIQLSDGTGYALPNPDHGSANPLTYHENIIADLADQLAAKDAEIARLKETGLPQTCAVKFPTDSGLGYFIGTDEFGKRLIESFIARAEAATARITELERQLAEAGEDKARLDWLDEHAYASGNVADGKPYLYGFVAPRSDIADGRWIRAAIDAARDRKEGV
jgi:hypothetical protein